MGLSREKTQLLAEVVLGAFVIISVLLGYLVYRRKPRDASDSGSEGRSSPWGRRNSRKRENSVAVRRSLSASRMGRDAIGRSSGNRSRSRIRGELDYYGSGVELENRRQSRSRSRSRSRVDVTEMEEGRGRRVGIEEVKPIECDGFRILWTPQRGQNPL